MAGVVPALRRVGRWRPVHRRRRPRLRRPLPGRHRLDDRPLPAGGRGGGARAHRARHHHDAPLDRRDLGRRRAQPSLRPPPLADGDDRHRRQPLRAALRPPPHRSAADRGDGLVLPRHRRRDPRRARARPRRRPRGGPTGRARPAGRRRRDDRGRAVQRPRRARRTPRRGRRRVPADGAGAHQHRHRAARRGLPGRRPRDHPQARRAAGQRRDPHDLRRSGRCDRGLGPRPRLRGDRQADRRAASRSRPTA